jgi:hypothetical protein
MTANIAIANARPAILAVEPFIVSPHFGHKVWDVSEVISAALYVGDRRDGDASSKYLL